MKKAGALAGSLMVPSANPWNNGPADARASI